MHRECQGEEGGSERKLVRHGTLCQEEGVKTRDSC